MNQLLSLLLAFSTRGDIIFCFTDRGANSQRKKTAVEIWGEAGAESDLEMPQVPRWAGRWSGHTHRLQEDSRALTSPPGQGTEVP